MENWTTKSRTFRSFLLVAQLDPAGIRTRIRQARKEQGLTQQELADLIESHKRTIENYENTRVPDYKQLNVLARALGRPTEWFLYGGDPDQDRDSEVRALRGEVGEIREQMAEVLRLLQEAAEPAPEPAPEERRRSA